MNKSESSRWLNLAKKTADEIRIAADRVSRDKDTPEGRRALSFLQEEASSSNQSRFQFSIAKCEPSKERDELVGKVRELLVPFATTANEQARKLIPVLERLKAVVEDACAHSKEGAFLFKRKEYVDAVMELWNNQSSAEYSVESHDTTKVTEIWLAIRLGLIAYLESIINGPKGVIRAFKSPGCYLLFERFINVNEDPHVLDLIPMKELFCTLKIEEKPRKTIKVKKPSSDKKRKEQEPQVDVDALPLKHYRFAMSRDYTTIVDCEHRRPDYEIDPYLKLKQSVANLMKRLIAEAGKKRNEGWLRAEVNWRSLFQGDLYRRLRNEQIERGKIDGLSHWRIIPTEEFHDHYRNTHPNDKNW